MADTESIPISERKSVRSLARVVTVTTPLRTVTEPLTPGCPARNARAARSEASPALAPARDWVTPALAAARAAPAAAVSARLAAAIFWPPSMTRPAVMISAAKTTVMNTLTDCPRSSRRGQS